MRIIYLILGLLWLLPPLAAAESATGAPGTISVGSAAITYYAQSGDTLLAIASRYTGRSANWAEIGKLNRIDRDVSIPVGSAIVIPARLLPDEPNQARVVAFSGQVSASDADGAPITVATGSVLNEGSRITTGGNSFLTLALADRSRIAIPSNSQVRLTRLRMARYTGSPRTEITLRQGRVESWVTPLEPRNGSFEVHTPRSVTGVRGTHFRVALSERGAASEVLDGSVDSGTAAAPATLVLRGGHGNVVGAGGVGPAIALLPAPRLAAAPTADDGQLHFELEALAGARAYQVQIATDADAQHLIAESRAAERRLELPLPAADGDYFIRISAIDANGLEGFAATRRVTLPAAPAAARPARAATPQPAPFVDSNDRDRLWLRWQGQPGRQYQVQVARDPGFTWLLLSATTEVPEIRLTRPTFGTYYARVQALHADGSAEPFSLAQAFVVTDHWIIHDGQPFAVKEARLSGAR